MHKIMYLCLSSVIFWSIDNFEYRVELLWAMLINEYPDSRPRLNVHSRHSLVIIVIITLLSVAFQISPGP